jgi:hypothetical protein
MRVRRLTVATEDLTRMLDEAGVRYEFLPHSRTESAAAEAKELGLAPDEGAKTLIVSTPERQSTGRWQDLPVVRRAGRRFSVAPRSASAGISGSHSMPT